MLETNDEDAKPIDSPNTPSVRDSGQTAKVIDRSIAIAAVVLAKKPDMDVLNSVAAVSRYVELVVSYPRILKFRRNLADALDDLASLLEQRGSILARKVRRVCIQARALEGGAGARELRRQE